MLEILLLPIVLGFNVCPDPAATDPLLNVCQNAGSEIRVEQISLTEARITLTDRTPGLQPIRFQVNDLALWNSVTLSLESGAPDGIKIDSAPNGNITMGSISSCFGSEQLLTNTLTMTEPVLMGGADFSETICPGQSTWRDQIEVEVSGDPDGTVSYLVRFQ